MVNLSYPDSEKAIPNGVKSPVDIFTAPKSLAINIWTDGALQTNQLII